MRNYFSKGLVSILLILCMLANMAPVTWAAELTNRDLNVYEAAPTDADIEPYSITDDIPSAGDIEHVHNSEGWQCYLTCDKEEHTHTIEGGCYDFICQEEEGEGHQHTIEGGCYQLNCTKEEHTHNEQECKWVCTTEYVLLTVEYYAVVNNQEVRIAETFQALLSKGDEYNAPIEAMKEKGYQVEEVQRRTKDDPNNPETVIFNEDDGSYIVSGTIENDTKISVKYKYTDELAPYQVDYWGCDANGQNDELIYSYIGKGPKDGKISASGTDVDTGVIPIKVNTLMQNLSDILNENSLGDSGAAFIENLIKAVDAKYNTEQNGELLHDITPLLESIAGSGDVDTLTRRQVKTYVDGKLKKAYGFDTTRQNVDEVGLVVTADELAKRNLYYVPKMPQTVLFTTGVPEAKVIGIPQETSASGGQTFVIETKENSIITQPEVDISEYTKNIYASHQSFIFIGWVTGEGAGVIRDYTDENASGKYKDLTIYTADGDGGQPQLPADVKTEKLSDALRTMPDGGATYYGVWKPFGSTYTVQLWFESEKGDNTYVESHALDIKDRMKPTDGTITFNDFDVNRAKEETIVAAANNADGAIFDAITFKDPDGGTTDTYHSYADYQNSPFFGFDFLECPVCAVDPSKCGTDGCTCGHQRKTNADGTEGDVTTERACNYQQIEVNTSGDTVLNLYYTREMWEIAMNPSVQLWTVEALERPTELNPYTYWVGGRRQKEIAKELEDNSSNYLIIQGKYGVPVEEAYKNDIGWENIGSAWQNEITEDKKTYTIAAGTNILLANGSEAFQQSDKVADPADAPWGVKRESGCYIYPQDTRTYIFAVNGAVAEPQEWALPFNCLSTIDPGMFTGHTAEADTDTDTGYTRIQAGVSKWEGNRFGQESSFDLTTGEHTYGTHRLNVYPYYHAISDQDETLAKHIFKINYYVQALPHEEASSSYVYTAANNDKLAFSKGETVTMEVPSSKLNYVADTPEGLVPLMWRTSPRAFSARNGFQGQGTLIAAQRYTNPQIVSTSTRIPYAIAVTPASVNMNSIIQNRYHNGSFNQYNRRELNGNSVYLSDWRQLYVYNRPTQDNASLASLDPSGYWVVDWIRVGGPVTSGNWNQGARLTGTLTGATGLYNLIDLANQGDANAITLLEQLESSFMVGALFPSGSGERIYYHRQNPNAFRYGQAGAFSSPLSLQNSENAVAFARKQYTITYNTCYLNDDGTLVRDQNGDIRTDAVHTTKYLKGSDNIISDKGDMIYYDQPLGYNPAKGSAGVLSNFDDYYNNYYDAYFAVDTSTDTGFSWLGYGNKSSEATGLGGYGKWYLDPDGTIPFTEENMEKMPAGNIDVYYHYTKKECKIYFVDDVTGKDNEPVDGMEHVINNQTLTPGTKASRFDGDEPVDPDGELYFVGWFYDRGGAKPYSFYDEIPQDTIVYAIWRPKLPTEYKIRHVLVDENGKEIKVIEETDWAESYVGDTVDAKAKETTFYDEPEYAGVYLVSDDYSKTMVLKKDKDDNILTFRYKIPGKHYTVEYRDIDSRIEILPEEEIQTKLSQVTVGLKEISGWTYQGYTVDDSELAGGIDSQNRQVTVTVTNDGVVVTFWYQRIPIDNTIRAMKLLDDVVLTEGTWFDFELVDENGEVVKTAQSVNGFIDFSLVDLKLDKAGTYKYTLREKNDGGHFKYDDTVYDVEVVVTQPDVTRPLESTITYYKNGEVVKAEELNFNNYRLPAQVELTADKYVNDQPGDGFKFELEGGREILICDKHIHNAGCYNRKLTCGQEEGPDHTHTDECYVLICGQEDDPTHEHTDECYEKELVCEEETDPTHTAHDRDCYGADNTQIDEKTASGGKVAFETLSFDETGTYIYKIYELNEGEPNVEYDETEYFVVIEVFINEDNEMDTKVTTLLNGEEVEGMEFRNYRKTPTKPDDPDDPTPTRPDDPDNPTPTRPDDPGDSTPTRPDDPGNSAPINPNDPGNSTLSTGDDMKLGLWLILMGISAISIIATLAVSKLKSRKKHSRR